MISDKLRKSLKSYYKNDNKKFEIMRQNVGNGAVLRGKVERRE